MEILQTSQYARLMTHGEEDWRTGTESSFGHKTTFRNTMFMIHQQQNVSVRFVEQKTTDTLLIPISMIEIELSLYTFEIIEYTTS